MSILFRFKNGCIAKGRKHRPTLTKLSDLKHYTKVKYRQIDIILDFNTMEKSDFIKIYTMLNRKLDNIDRPYECLIGRMTRMSSSVTTFDGKIYRPARRFITYDHAPHTPFTIWINNSPDDFLSELWLVVRDALFGNVPKTVRLDQTERRVLRLADYNGTIKHVKLKSPDKRVKVDTLRHEVIGNYLTSTLVEMGSESIDGDSKLIREYELNHYSRWMLVIPNIDPSTATIYTLGNQDDTTPSPCWDNYIGRVG